MPPLPVVPDVIRVNITQDIGNDVSVGSRFFFQYSGGAPSGANLTAAAALVEGIWATNFNPLQWVEQATTKVELTDLSTESGAYGIWTGTDPGTREGNPLPIGVSTLINFQIVRRYRGGKPRMYFVGGVQGDMTNQSEWTAAYVEAVKTAWQTFAAAMPGLATAGFAFVQHVSISYYQGFTAYENPRTGRYKNSPNVRSGAVPVDVVVNTDVPRTFSSQRRRNRVGV